MVTLKVGSATAEPGAKGLGAVEVTRRHDGSQVIIPVMLANGLRDGPTLVVQAAVHANEYPGVEAIWRLMESLDPAQLSGRVIGVPVANVPGFAIDERFNDIDHQDLNRIFPGRAQGTLSQQTAHQLLAEVISQGSYLIDLHSASDGEIVPMAYAREGYEEMTLELAKASGFEYICKARKVGEAGAERATDSALRNGIPGVILEAGSGREYRPEYAGILYGAVVNIMKYLGMIQGQPTGPARRILFKDDLWAQATVGGFFRPHVVPGQRLKKGDLIATVHDVYGREMERIEAPRDGFICLINKKRSVQPGHYAHIFGDILEEEILGRVIGSEGVSQ